MTMNDLFDDIFELPDPDRQEQFASLVGLKEVQARLVKEGRVLFDPDSLEAWSMKFHHAVLPAIQALRRRPPLMMFAGDVGTGKTTLAESFGDAIARQEKIGIMVMRMSLRTRGSGAVGEMTRLIGSAFNEVAEVARKGKRARGKPGKAVILIIDEADALAQTRETEQMHHEDRAGVNALIRGIDGLSASRLPAIVVMCTNRLDAMDPAVMRRACVSVTFHRPDESQRAQVLQAALGHALNRDVIVQLAKDTGPAAGREYGYTYSDLSQRLIPAIVLDAYPDRAITCASALATLVRIEPSRPFASASSQTSGA
jgi:SpoVK/Ycf46/Vps4 family AAA+-type ATPase